MVKNPFIGKMDRLVDIKKTVKTQSQTGAQKTSDELVCRSWACLESQKGSEEVDGKVMHSVSSTYTMRYNSDVKKNGKDYFLVDDGLKYRINHITELGRKRHIQLDVALYE